MSGPGPTGRRAGSVRITGWGSYVPERVLTNADLERIVDTSDEWIRTRTGIRERRVAAPARDDGHAGRHRRQARRRRGRPGARRHRPHRGGHADARLPHARRRPSSSRRPSATARAAAFDVAAACSGFVYGYATADAYVRSGMARHVLVIGAELLTRFLDFTDRTTCILFGDGAGAVVLSASDEEGGGLAGLELTTDPDGAYMIWLPSGGSRSPSSLETARRGEHFIRMEGRETYRYATRTLAASALAAIEQGRLDSPTRSTSSSPTRPTSASSSRWPRGWACPWSRWSSTSTATATPRQPPWPSPSTRPSAVGRVKPGDKARPLRLRGRLHQRRGGHHLDRRPGHSARSDGHQAGGQRAGAARLGLGRSDAAAAGGRARRPGRAAGAARRRHPGRTRSRRSRRRTA